MTQENNNSNSKIPKDAQIVFKGIRFDVYEWQQKQFDLSYKTYQAVKRFPSSQAIVVTDDKRIVLLKEEQPYIGKFTSIPGGTATRGEKPYDAIKKELLEELGIKSDDIKLWRKIHLGHTIVWERFFYIVKNYEIVDKPNLGPSEKITPVYLEVDEFLQETQKKEFRNKSFANLMFHIMKDKIELNKFKKELFG